METGVVRVLGRTRADGAVGINGVPAEVSADGSFAHDLLLVDGINFVEVVATDLAGNSNVEQVAVFSIAPTAGLPFALFYPSDGLEVKSDTITIMGGTRPDAVVGINGAPVDVDSLGIFSAIVNLEVGANFIEVVATDVDSNVRFQTVAVFYLP